ncbi:GntR family transcriptional regulator [Maliponia aquimaris]|uniref:Putative HTH-type transcriptional regulator YdfH n=1 Tax=Maliponia aquimaris TaxID=1673631 RepID=A0A238L086_9RHOB|nr:GntR family transcriptional regulator [Maliponia aquimaris]SMX47862.1 putative HTH-type transcriptional regulator YdfH [Maliponia aquimaris]
MNVFDPQDARRLTTSEEVFRQLKSDIIAMRLLPGAKISEVEVAKTYNVSRQPVREAFMRLGELDLLEIRPQRATRVRKISHQKLRDTRFIRAAVEVEVVRVACTTATPESLEAIAANIEQQREAVAAGNAVDLKTLDYEFHRLICVAADRLPAFKVISENKAHTERACTLELNDATGMREVLEGHVGIFEAIKAGDAETAVARTRVHLAHLDGTLISASQNNPDFFED